MRFRERFDETPDQESHHGSPGNLEGLREAGEEFLTAGDDAIDKALSANSETYLAATRQLGGE